MPINPALLVSAPMLQDYFVDKDTGLPLQNGIVTCYQDNSRTTLKNWYYQTGVPGNYTYIPLPNPMVLSAVGTIVDVNGNDTIPFFYPFSELDNSTVQTYYITVVSQDLQSQFVRANFPFVPNQVNEVSVDKNYSLNNSFWRNIGSVPFPLTKTTNVTGSTLFYETVAPNQHDGFIMPDMLYMKSANASMETITFKKFPNGSNPLVGDITPEYYLEHNCASPAPEGSKFYQIPISLHIKQLESTPATITIQAISNSGTANDVITISIFQFNGTGTTQTSPVLLDTIQLTSSWTKYTIPFTFPSTAGAPISPGDDAWYLRIGVPANQQFDLSFTLPSIYLSQNNLPTNNFTTYDEAETIINSPRTGDVRVSMNDFYPYGWVPMNDGTIGNASSNATTRANTDTWQLFYLLYNKFFPYTNGTTNQIIQLFNSAGTAIVWSGSAITDFNANNQLSLTKMMGKVLLGTVPIDALISSYKSTFTASNNAGRLLITTTNNMNFYKGMPVVFTNQGGALPGNLISNHVYYVAAFGVNTIFVAADFASAMADTYIAFVDAGSGTNTVISDLNGSPTGEYAHTQLESELATHFHNGTTMVVYGSGAGGIVHPLGAAVPNASGTVVINVAPDGNSVPFNVTQPATLNNFYIKL
jgi:hypothetical protein